MTGDNDRLQDYVAHILQSIARIREYTQGMNEEAFVQNILVQDAVIRNLEVIGEASRNIERVRPAFLKSHPEIRLSDAYAMRIVLAHSYFGVDIGIVWSTIQTQLPVLESQLQPFA